MKRSALPFVLGVYGTLLREWAYRFSYSSSDDSHVHLSESGNGIPQEERRLTAYVHFYNYDRAHSSLAYNPPISRLGRNNVLKRNS